MLTESGRSLDADLVVMGTGAVPDVMLARSAGLELGETGGVACSSTLETSAPGVWCAGDACEYDSVLHGRRVRIEHWEVARAQGKAVAAAVAGRAADFGEVPYFWSDIADWATVEYVGRRVVLGPRDRPRLDGLRRVRRVLRRGLAARRRAVGRDAPRTSCRRGGCSPRAASSRDAEVLADVGADLSAL